MKPDRKYLENKVLNASPEELLLMLFDGAIRFATTGREKLEAGDYEASCQQLLRAQNIMLELMGSLNREDLGDALFESLTGLYQFVHQRLMRGSFRRDAALIDEALRVLANLRASWAQAVDQDRDGRRAVLEGAQAALRTQLASSPAPLDLKG